MHVWQRKKYNLGKAYLYLENLSAIDGTLSEGGMFRIFPLNKNSFYENWCLFETEKKLLYFHVKTYKPLT